jgi:SWI/SNF-related matrix-associated actin-dependent regulator of chromatin subfamily A member 5
VTDGTVEVKIVERARQKLKLDAMVVQQGCLQEKEKKLSKEDLLEALRFGANKIFRTDDSTITDADIDLILEEGRKRTKEMSEKLTCAEKEDMYDFRLDVSLNTQVFEGKDYSKVKPRGAKFNFHEPFIGLGARERKTLVKNIPNIPQQLELYDRQRLEELNNEEARLFLQFVNTVGKVFYHYLCWFNI